MWGWIILGVVGAVAVISVAQYRANAGTYRPLSSRQPPRPAARKTPLGMEAIDMGEITRTNRRNESLERAHTNWTQKRDQTAAAATQVDPMPDDETYAAHYHRAFIKDKKDKSHD